MPDFTGLLGKYPGLAVELVVSEQMEDLVAERLDLALRFGQSPDTSLVSRALAHLGSAPVAAPAYLERYGAPEHPSDLVNHGCIIHERGRGQHAMDVYRPGWPARGRDHRRIPVQ